MQLRQETPPPRVGFSEKLKIRARLILHKPAPGDAHVAGDQSGVHARAHEGKHRVDLGGFFANFAQTVLCGAQGVSLGGSAPAKR